MFLSEFTGVLNSKEIPTSTKTKGIMAIQKKPLGTWTFLSLCLLFVLFTAVGCGGDTIDDFTSAFQNEEIKVYLERFADEASTRDISVDLSRTEAVFVGEIFFNGQRACIRNFENFENQGNSRIEVSRNIDCWDAQSDQARENLLFRELGAAILGRLNNNTKLPNGLSASLMCNDCDIFSLYDESTINRREYYLNELMQIEQEIPEWGK